MLVEMQQDQFNELYDLMTQSFPPDEFRPYEKQRALLEKPEYTVYIHQKNNEIGAFSRLGKQMNLCFSNTLL